MQKYKNKIPGQQVVKRVEDKRQVFTGSRLGNVALLWDVAIVELCRNVAVVDPLRSDSPSRF
jgi:hypothetical protein